ncbi:hypothetical protein MMC30_002498 [Trapelia coarctata]|nr:hypothetical protein [Trapelia coarctata]
MSRRPNPAADRAAQNQQTIKSLLKLEGNKSCADCKRNKHPRWASWNLGIFVCIRCSGIHRGMGTHISRVKSVDLDSWTDEQLQSVLRWGNARANKYWEAKLAPGHVPSEAKIENFIRTKYESKRWVMEGPIPDPSTLDAEGDDDVPLNIVQEKAKLDRSSSQRVSSAPAQQPPPPAKKPAPTFDLIGGDDMPTPPARPSTTDNSATAKPPPPKPATSSQLLGGFDFFGGPPERPASAASTPAGTTGMSRPDLKQSILSLYATAPKPQPLPQSPTATLPPQQHGRQTSFGGMQSSTTQSSTFGGLDDAFSSLNFGTSSSTSTPQSQPQQAKPSAFPSFSQNFSQRSTPTAPQITSQPLSGGGFFDTGPKPQPPPKPNAPQSLRKISNASSGFGEFSSALNPLSGSSIANSSNGLLDLSSPQSIASARPVNPSKPMSSIFNLSAQPPNYQPVVQSSAPPTKSTFSIPTADPWGSSNAWATSEPAPPTPKTQSNAKSPSVSSATGGDFGWGNSPAPSAGMGAGIGFSSVQSPPGGGGFGTSSFPPAKPSPPKIATDEDFGGWNTAAPETPAVPSFTAPISASPWSEPAPPAAKPAAKANPSEDLWSNVWE